LADPGYHINHSNLLVLESKADMQNRGQASPDDGVALALTFAQPVEPAARCSGSRSACMTIGVASSVVCAFLVYMALQSLLRDS
jgi:hypothetical protein